MNDGDFDNQGASRGGRRSDSTGGQASMDDLVGAYLLDALTEAERVAFEAFLRESPAAQEEVAQLRPVVDLLPLALDAAGDDPSAVDVAPSPGLRDRIILAARAEVAVAEAATTPLPPLRQAGAIRHPTAERAPQSEPIPIRPPGRIRPGGRPGEDRGGGFAAIGVWRIAAAILAAIAVAAVIWAVTLQNRIGGLEGDIDELQGTITASGGTQTLAYILRPTDVGPPTAAGVLFPDPEENDARLDLVGLLPLPAGQVYQLWFIDLDETGNPAAPPTPSVTFSVDAQGNGAVTGLPLPTTAFNAVAVTIEPEGGSQSPTSDIQMIGTAGTAAG